MDKEIMRGSIDIIILAIINISDTYGYKIAKIIKEKSCEVYCMGEGTLYPALKRLEGKGFINSYWKENNLVGRRKYYTITKLGKENLLEKLNQWEKVTSLINIFRG